MVSGRAFIVLAPSLERVSSMSGPTPSCRRTLTRPARPALPARPARVPSPAATSPGTLDFSEFVQATATYCMFGPEDVRKFCFYIFDKDKNGYEEDSLILCISHAQFSESNGYTIYIPYQVLTMNACYSTVPALCLISVASHTHTEK